MKTIEFYTAFDLLPGKIIPVAIKGVNDVNSIRNYVTQIMAIRMTFVRINNYSQ
ncbi:MAG: hypothetical protein ACQESX_10630 [Bacteroidota bacterium]